jgi:hypothetical protein
VGFNGFNYKGNKGLIMGAIYIEKPELSYVHIPRTGMGMKILIEEYLKPNFDIKDEDEWMVDHPNLKTIREHYPTAKTFTVVRNPWMRLYSFYKKINEEGYWLDWNDKQLMDLKPFNEWIADYCNPEVVFEFPRWFNRFTSMNEFITDGDTTVDFILKAENLEQDMVILQGYLNFYLSIPDISKTNNHHEYRDYYTTESREMIRKLFEIDCDKFNYTY